MYRTRRIGSTLYQICQTIDAEEDKFSVKDTPEKHVKIGNGLLLLQINTQADNPEHNDDYRVTYSQKTGCKCGH